MKHGKRKPGAADIIGEALRLEGCMFLNHVPDPEPAQHVCGMALEDVSAWYLRLVNQAEGVMVPSLRLKNRGFTGKDAEEHQRPDTPIILGVVCSWPAPFEPEEYGTPEHKAWKAEFLKSDEYREWSRRNQEFVGKMYGSDHIAFGVTHTDEGHIHQHFLVHNCGQSVKPLMLVNKGVALAEGQGWTGKAITQAAKAGKGGVGAMYQKMVGEPMGLKHKSDEPRTRDPDRPRFLLDQAEKRAKAIEAEAQAGADQLRRAAQREAKEDAEAEAAEIVARAKRVAAQVLAQTQAEADLRLRSVDQVRAVVDALPSQGGQVAHALRAALAKESLKIAKLEQANTRLEQQVGKLEEQVDEQRDQIAQLKRRLSDLGIKS